MLLNLLHLSLHTYSSHGCKGRASITAEIFDAARIRTLNHAVKYGDLGTLGGNSMFEDV